MQIRHFKSAHQPADAIQKVTALAWSGNGRRLAVVTERIVSLYDEKGERQDKFSTKPSDPKGPKNYTIKGMAFSPDSSKLAIAQSDNIVFVYKLGLEWGEKKSICNKFLQATSVTSVCWPHKQLHELVFGLAEGKVKVGQIRSNKPATLYVHPEGSMVVSLCAGPDGHSVISGHLDGSLYRFSFQQNVTGGPMHQKFAHHTSVPYALSWGQAVFVGGSDCKAVLYSSGDGEVLQQFDFVDEDGSSEFNVAAFNPSGESVVAGSFSRFHVFSMNTQRQQWELACVKTIPNLYTVSALVWKPDGSRIALGNLCGGVELFDACIRRYKYKGKFEMIYVSNSQVIVKRLSTGSRIAVRSFFGYDIVKINIYKENFIVAYTPNTIIVSNIETCKSSEIEWSEPPQSSRTRFFFDNPSVCMIYSSGELSLIEYGSYDVLGSCRTEHVSPFLISVRINELRSLQNDNAGGSGGGGSANDAVDNKKIAYLMDAKTVRVADLVTNSVLATVNHDSKIDWLELNARGTHLLFRDKRRQLHLYTLRRQERNTLLNYCGYVQWVPFSDVVVAQNRGNLCVWYSIDKPERVTIFPIKGEVEDIERSNGGTEIIVDEGIQTVSYALDEALIEFGTAVEARDYEGACKILEPLELTSETEAMWQQLGSMALEDRQLQIAEQCSAALGDVCKARYLRNLVRLEAADDGDGAAGGENFQVTAGLSCLHRQWKAAEKCLLDHGRTDEAIQMYTECNRWDDAISVAEMTGHPEAEALRRKHFEWLLQTGQEEEAGALREREGDYPGAVQLFLKGGLPARAAAVVKNSGGGKHGAYAGMQPPSWADPHLLETIVIALTRAEMHEKAGNFFAEMGRLEEAMDAYRQGKAFRRAVELARRAFPREVVTLEHEWADWLSSQRQPDAAINHYIEAGQNIKAIEAALDSRQYTRAADIAESLEAVTAKPYYRRIAEYHDSVSRLEEAERFYVRCGAPGEAVDMYTRAGRWEAAHKVAVAHLTDKEVSVLFIKRARELEAQSRFKEAEKMYVTVKEYDLAINMYKKCAMYTEMIRLVTVHRKELLNDTHLHLANKLEAEGNFRQAEHHFLQAQDWQSCLKMYRAHDLWDDAIRVAKVHGGTNASKQVAYAWAVCLGGDEGAALLTKFGLVEQAIDYAIESGAFVHAFEIAGASMKTKLPDVHLKYAMYLEDEGRFQEAEREFLEAEKPREAIDMYLHQLDWQNAVRVAEAHDPDSMSDITVAQARDCVDRKDYAKAETLFLRARRAELLIEVYKDAAMWEDALRVAETHMPSRMAEVQMALASAATSRKGDGSGKDSIENVLSRGRVLEQNRDFIRAIDVYLSPTASWATDVDDDRSLNALENVWKNAVRVAREKLPERAYEVVSKVAAQLQDIQQHLSAAMLYESIDAHKEAADVYINGNYFDRAIALGNSVGGGLARYVEDRRSSHLASGGSGAGVGPGANASVPYAGDRGAGGVGPGALLGADVGANEIDIHMKQGNWDRVHQLAEKEGANVATHYAIVEAKQLAAAGMYDRAIAVLAARGVSNVAKETVETISTIVRAILARAGAAGGDDATHAQAEMHSAEVLYKLQSHASTLNADNRSALMKLFLSAHYTVIKNRCREAGLLGLYATTAQSLLRFIGFIPVDRAFYEAGVANREAGRLNLAFVCLNRFLDIAEAMDEQDSALSIENHDFVNTGVPFEFELPTQHYVPESEREEIRDWVLSISMDQSVDQSLSTRVCSSCRTEIYEGALECHQCKTQSEECFLTGAPILPGERYQPDMLVHPVRRDAWSEFTAKLGDSLYSNS